MNLFTIIKYFIIFIYFIRSFNTYEEYEKGKPISKITPFWRALSAKSPSAKKLSFGIKFLLDQQKKEAEAEKVPEVAVEEPAGKSFTYQADAGESAETIAKHFGLTVDQLKALNPSGVKGGSKVKVKVQAIHIVGKGDVLRVVAEKYHISKKALMDANHKKEDVTMRGEELVIPLQ